MGYEWRCRPHHRWKQIGKIFYKNGNFHKGIFTCIDCGSRKQMNKTQIKRSHIHGGKS